MEETKNAVNLISHVFDCSIWYITTLNILLFFFSVVNICLHSELRITASPARYFLLFWMFIIAACSVVTVNRNRNRGV